MTRPPNVAVVLLSVHHPAPPVPASPTPTHMTDLSTHLPQSLANDYSSFRSEPSTILIKGEGRAWLSAGFHGKRRANLMSIPLKLVIFPPQLCPHQEHRLLLCLALLPTAHSEVLVRSLLQIWKLTLVIKPVVSLVLTPHSFFSLAGQAQAQQASRMQPNNPRHFPHFHFKVKVLVTQS